MTKKRKQIDSNQEDTLYNKRSRFSQADGDDNGSPSANQPRLDPTYGQRGAFPGLDSSNGDDELFYGPAADGLEYLRMVRSEAKGVPNLLVAPTLPTDSPKDDDGLYEDYPQGYYADGAYTAVPFASSHNTTQRADDGTDEDLDPQEAYYSTLLARFSSLSSIFQTPPALTPGTPIPQSSYRPKQWQHKILKTIPKTILLAQIPQESIIDGLEVLEDVLTARNLRNGAYGRNIGAWAWALLARCRDVGVMGSEEVGVVRRVGKKAVWLLRRIAAGEVVDDEIMGNGQTQDEEEDSAETDAGDATAKIDKDDDETQPRDPNTKKKNDEDNIATSSQPDIPPLTSTNQPPTATPSNPDASEAALAAARHRILASLHAHPEIPSETETPNSSELHQQHNPPPPPAPPTPATTQTTPPLHHAPSKPSKALPDIVEIELDKETITATLDTIVTIVGECYGQRDLLEGRVVWGERRWSD